MKAINYHIKAITKTFGELFKGNYLIYLLPGLIITILFGFFFYEIGVLDGATDIGGDEPLGDADAVGDLELSSIKQSKLPLILEKLDNNNTVDLNRGNRELSDVTEKLDSLLKD